MDPGLEYLYSINNWIWRQIPRLHIFGMKLYSWMTQEKGIPHIPSNKNNCSQTQYYQIKGIATVKMVWFGNNITDWLTDWQTRHDHDQTWVPLKKIKNWIDHISKLNWKYQKDVTVPGISATKETHSLPCSLVAQGSTPVTQGPPNSGTSRESDDQTIRQHILPWLG